MTFYLILFVCWVLALILCAKSPVMGGTEPEALMVSVSIVCIIVVIFHIAPDVFARARALKAAQNQQAIHGPVTIQKP
jgi:hypothetical protein